MFLIEGHTDAVGNDVDNLSLSDRRARIGGGIADPAIPASRAENLTSQGYGEQYLKVQTSTALHENRRVTMRRITPLLNGGQAVAAASAAAVPHRPQMSQRPFKTKMAGNSPGHFFMISPAEATAMTDLARQPR